MGQHSRKVAKKFLRDQNVTIVERSRSGTFYLTRVIKGRSLTHGQILTALEAPRPVKFRNYGWTFTDYSSAPDGSWHFANLAKYSPEGIVTTIDHAAHREVPRLAEDMIAAKSPFVYLPEYSGIAYLHVWNQITRQSFPRRFAELVASSNFDLMVDCQLEPISDPRSFIRKLESLDSISNIKAKVHLPNPLFGPIWKSLFEYVQSRRAASIQIEEQAAGDSLHTNLSELVRTEEPKVLPPSAQTGDAAVLMALDGYGHARVRGLRGKSVVTIRTSDTQINFQDAPDLPAEQLATEVLDVYRRHTDNRQLSHSEEQ